MCQPSQTADTPEAFDIAQAMTMLYGNYDTDKDTSTVSFSESELAPEHSGWTAGEPMCVRPLFHAFSGDAGARTFVLLTYAVSDCDQDSYCHACNPAIGMAMFSQEGRRWVMTASNRVVTSAGDYGNPPTDIKLIQIGSNRPAVKIIDFGGGQGEGTQVLLILAPWNRTVNLALERAVFDTDGGNCADPKSDDSRLPCYENQRTYTFLPDGNADYYKLVLKLSGTDIPSCNSPEDCRLRRVRGTETWKFENGKYVLVSRQGDVASIDSGFDETPGKQK